jgi:glycerol kinase
MSVALSLALACSDDKPKSAGAQQTTGSESGLDRTKDRVNTAHDKFKEEIHPVAGWVDEKSHRVVDEAESAVEKGKKKLDGDDDDHDHDHDKH